MSDPMALLALAAVIVASIGLIAQLRARSVDEMRASMTEQLHQRDVVIAELQGQLNGLKDTLESFARAFIDRRNHP